MSCSVVSRVSNDLISTKENDKREIGYRWVIFDNEVPDDVLRELMAPVEPADIIRGVETSVVGFYSDRLYDYELLRKVREWEKNFAIPHREEKESRRREPC